MVQNSDIEAITKHGSKSESIKSIIGNEVIHTNDLPYVHEHSDHSCTNDFK